MAGRKQHFIQRLLLKGFAFNAPNGTNRVWVYPKEGKIFPSALEGYGAERDFYGRPGESKLDDGISEQENKRFNNFLKSLARNLIGICVLMRRLNLQYMFSSDPKIYAQL